MYVICLKIAVSESEHININKFVNILVLRNTELLQLITRWLCERAILF